MSTVGTNGQHLYRQQRVNYFITVKLDDEAHTLDAFVKLNYINHSPDTLRFIWFHVWPNAYKNDRTAFSDQLLENGRTDFYFSESNEKGYLNRLDFRVNDVRADMEDHPEHIDIVKVLLPKALLPGDSIVITTPFYVKLPKNFSRGGHIGKSYQITQWYPKPAVYDHTGWHPMAYLDQGEFYASYGDYEVEITVPQSYHVLSSGILQNPDDDLFVPAIAEKPTVTVKKKKPEMPPARSLKTLVYRQQNIHDFAWFASGDLFIQKDTLRLPSGRTVNLQAASLLKHKTLWSKVIPLMKSAVLQRSQLIGEYQYDILSVIEIPVRRLGGMEYPCIASVSGIESAQELAEVIGHEIGHNWFQGMIGNNERAFPWMDEGLNTYYDRRFAQRGAAKKIFNVIDDNDDWLSLTYQRIKKDQPVSTASEEFSETNYYLSSYHKAAQLLEQIEKKMGRSAFDSAMHMYFEQWKFAHPYPNDFFQILQRNTSVRLDTIFNLFKQKGELPVHQPRKSVSFGLPGTFSGARQHILFSPIAGYNMTDGFMPGAVLTNYNLPPSRFQWLLAPLYGTQSRELNYAARLGYTWYPHNIFDRIHFSVSAMKFNTREFTDTASNKYITGFRKFVPALKFVFRSDNARSTKEKYLQWKSFFINEDRLRFTSDTFANGDRFVSIAKVQTERVLHQLNFVIRDTRALYPYQLLLQAERSDLFTRLSFTGNYYFNYNKKEGAQVRFFAGKFLYNGERSLKNISATAPFHLNLTGPRGDEDYTYSNYFVGRNEFEGFASQQIMMRDGGFKIRTDLLAGKVGRSDNWLMAMNFVSDIPENINLLRMLPFNIPLKLFLDIGTFSDAWQKGYEGSKILYNAGFQLPLLGNAIQVYIPILYSKVYRDYVNTIVTGNKLLNTISFSIDIQQLSLNRLNKRLPY